MNKEMKFTFYLILKIYLFLSLLTIAMMFLLLLNCVSPTENVDKIPPSVDILSPKNNSIVWGVVTVTCIATDDIGLDKAELFLNGKSTRIIDNTVPFQLKWNTQGYVNNLYTITVRVYDINKNKTDSKPINLNVVNPAPISMIFVAGGTFAMGDIWGNGENDELPIHNVTVDSFYIGRYEITQAQWDTIMGNNPSNFQGDNRPVERITWFEAIDFCNSLSIHEGLTSCYSIDSGNVICDFMANGYRLPTEAECEFAARGGNLSMNHIFSGEDVPEIVAWYNLNSDDSTHEIATKQPNELGIYDMSGNVWEFCWDWYGNYSTSSQTNPAGPSNGTFKVIRGGAFNESSNGIRASEREKEIPNTLGVNNYIGFRVARTF